MMLAVVVMVGAGGGGEVRLYVDQKKLFKRSSCTCARK